MQRRYSLIILTITLALSVLVGSISAQDSPAIAETTQQLQGIVGDFWQRVQFASQDSVMQLVLIIGGAIMLLIGWRIYNFVIVLSGALFGALLAFTLITPTNFLLSILTILIGAAIGGITAIFLYYAVVFVVGAYIGVLLTLQLITSLSLGVDPLLAAIFGAILGGIILLGLSFELLVIISSIVGAQLLALGLGLNSWWILGFVIFGILWQITLAKAMGYSVRRRPTRRMLFRDA